MRKTKSSKVRGGEMKYFTGKDAKERLLGEINLSMRET